jgi:hypothetical protein
VKEEVTTAIIIAMHGSTEVPPRGATEFDENKGGQHIRNLHGPKRSKSSPRRHRRLPTAACSSAPDTPWPPLPVITAAREP